MSEILSLSLRPRALSSLYGQEALVASIRRHVAKRPPRAWLFYGGTGCGKTTIARILAVAYQCSHMSADKWGDPCDECWKRRNSFSIHEINASSVSGVGELEHVVETSRYKPSNSDGKRVIILDEAQRISNAAQNMLLTPFETPPDSTIWIVCTTEPNKILPTLRRRLTTYQLSGLTFTAAEKFLTRCAAKAGITRPIPPLVEHCHLMNVTAPALLLQALEKYGAGASPANSVTGSEASVEALRICKAVTSGDWKAVQENLKAATPDDVRLIRASVMGYLKGILAQETRAPLRERATLGIMDLATWAFDDSVALPWLYAALDKICRRYEKR